MGTLEPGAVINGRYQLARPIGSGGMARVWLAHDRLLDRHVAVKVLADRYASDPGFVERFRREASAAAGLSHPNIVTVYDRGETDGSYYIVMEHLPGPDLKEIIRQHGKLEPREAVDAALQVLAAVGAAHRRDVIHRDIKPQNVLVAEDGHLKVTDFGIARAGDDAGMTEVGSVIGTAQYLSPEQARGEEVTPASDCYSVGILMYEMLTGKVPFDGDKPIAIAMRQINEPPIAPRLLVPQIPPQLNDIVMKALEKRPANRYRSAEEFVAALMEIRPSLPAPTAAATQVLAAVEPPQTTRIIQRPPPPAGQGPNRRPPPGVPVPSSRRRWPLIVAILAALAVAGVVAGLLFTDVGRAAKVEVPSVAGENREQAFQILREAELVPTPASVNSATVPEGEVIDTDPPAGTSVSKGATVTVRISIGGAPADVPDVVGRQYEDARTTLVRENFRPTRVDVFSDRPDGEVVAQDPQAGDTATEGDEVTLSVSKGQEPVEMPQLLLKSRAEAEQILRDLGLKRGRVTERATSKRPPGTVLAQSVDAGRTIPKGSTIDITVAIAPQATTIAMPNVVGNSASAARSKLLGLGFGEPVTANVASVEPAGTVIEQDPPAGRQVDPAATTVTLTISDGSGAAPPTTDQPLPTTP